MSEPSKITHADMRSFIKYINFVSQNIILQEGEYRFNLQLDTYNPFASNEQPARAKLSDITHAMGLTILHSSKKRRPANRVSDTSAEELFFLHIKSVPEWIEDQINGADQERLDMIMYKVMNDHVMNAGPRSAAIEFLKPYIDQEELDTGPGGSLETFTHLKDRLNTIIEVLETLAEVHENIGLWAEETSRIGLLCEKPLSRTDFEDEMKKVGDIFLNYSDSFRRYKNYSLEVRSKLYSPGTSGYICLDPAIWLKELERGGHQARPGPVLLFDPMEMSRDQYLNEMERFLYDRMRKWASYVPSNPAAASMGSPASANGTGRAQSTPSHPGAGIHFPGDEQLTTVRHIEREDLESIDSPGKFTSQGNATVVSQNGGTGKTIVPYSEQAPEGGAYGEGTRTADLASGNMGCSSYPTSGWQQVLRGPPGMPGITGMYRNPPIMAPQAGAPMQSDMPPFSSHQSTAARGPPPPVSTASSPPVQCPGGVNTEGRQQRSRRDQTGTLGSGAQGAAGGINSHVHTQQQHVHTQQQVHAQNQYLNQYLNQYQYNQYMNQSMRHQQEQHQHMVDMTIEDLNSSLKLLKNEKDHVMARGNPDRLDDFLKRSLRIFHEDLVQARRGRYLTPEQVEYYQAEYSELADVVQDEKRDIRKKDDLIRNRKSLASINKATLPVLRDTLDGGPWIEQVDFIQKALTEQEQEPSKH